MIKTPFGFTTTAAEAVSGIDLTGRRALVTGAASGLGVETARALALAGAEVTLAVRDTAAGVLTAKDITATTGNEAVHVAEFHLTDLASVKAFTDTWNGPLHILVNNAGVMASPPTFTPLGWELQLATNHLGHFALATGLHSALAAEGARIVSVTSSGHMLSPVIFDDLNFAFRRYDPWLAYGQSKTANVLFAVGASRKWEIDGITTNAVMPGAIFTNLQRHIGGGSTGQIPPELMKTPQQGAATSIVVATSPLLEGIGGKYFVDCNETPVVDKRPAEPMQGVARYAVDVANAERLWSVSEEMCRSALH